ncbi:MAG: type II secretion system protein [Rhodocyclaceae bacterium]|nr:type II secretion system protein [Rhodocyclaceae bacterium]MBX3670498.1 type II secretion system protein [Rhodocyclaceae bacterium]
MCILERPCTRQRLTIAAYRARGVSLLELLVFIVVVGVAVAGVLSVLDLTVRKSADSFAPRQALAIAEALLEEVQLAAYTWCDPSDANVDTASSAAGCASLAESSGPEAGETRPFDNVNDYDGYSMSGIQDFTGAAIPGLAAYSAKISVQPAALNGITAASGAALRITVSVSGPSGTQVVVEGWRTRYAPNARP